MNRLDTVMAVDATSTEDAMVKSYKRKSRLPALLFANTILIALLAPVYLERTTLSVLAFDSCNIVNYNQRIKLLPQKSRNRPSLPRLNTFEESSTGSPILPQNNRKVVITLLKSSSNSNSNSNSNNDDDSKRDSSSKSNDTVLIPKSPVKRKEGRDPEPSFTITNATTGSSNVEIDGNNSSYNKTRATITVDDTIYKLPNKPKPKQENRESKRTTEKSNSNDDTNFKTFNNTSSSIRNDATVTSNNPLATQILISREDSDVNYTRGIGGDGGQIFNVNALKRNLLHDTVRAYKRELWRLLQQPQHQDNSVEGVLVGKLAALVQASAVRTTTDSNLLDGGVWQCVYTSKYSTVNDLLNYGQDGLGDVENTKSKSNKNSDKSNTNSNNSNQSFDLDKACWRRRGGRESLWKRQERAYRLEELDEDEDAYVLDQTFYFGGILLQTKRWPVRSLTRQAVRLQAPYITWKLFNKWLVSQRQDPEPFVPLSWDIVYSDVDLCIVSDGMSSNSRKDQDGYRVFTKQDDWIDASVRRQRKLRATLLYVPQLVWFSLSPIWKRRPFQNQNRRQNDQYKMSKINSNSNALMLQRIATSHQDNEDVVRVLNLGDLDSSDAAWDGLQDPFVHLSFEERQAVLKQLSVAQIAELGEQRQRATQKEKAWRKLTPWKHRRKTFYKKPK